MNLKTQVIIYNVNHYNMDNSKGLSVQVVGDLVDTNNKFGRVISNAEVPNYNELSLLKQIPPDAFPAKFEATLSLGVKKVNGKEVTAVSLGNLKYLNSMELVDRK